METILTILVFIGLGLCFLGLIYCMITLSRIHKVHDYRRELINLIGEASSDDIERGKDYKWRWEYFQRADFTEMVNKFWRPLDSWYPNTTFIEKRPPEKKKPEKRKK